MNINLIVLTILGTSTAVAAVNWIYFKILKIALDKKLVDIPDARKLQKRPVPVVGGLAVFFGLLSGMMVAASFNKIFSPDVICISLFPILIVMGMMLYIGAMDDIIGLTPKSRFIIEIASVLCLVFSSGMSIDTFRGMWGIESFSWWFAVPLTVFAGVGIINAINMIDGVNGLSSGLCINCCVLFGTAFIKADDISNAVLAFTMAGALIPFFIHNVFGLKSRMFIGDAGTMVMGILMTWFLICVLSSDSKISYYEAAEGVNMIALSLAILSVPVFDTLRVMSMRIANKKSPFKPDKTHLHHAFINIGVSHFITSMIEIFIGMLVTSIWGVSIILGASLELQLYIVIVSSVIFVWGPYVLIMYHANRHTTFLHRIIGFSIRTHLGRTEWWKAISAWLDAPGDYSGLTFDAEHSINKHIKSIGMNNYKEQDRKRILEYIKGKAEVYVSDIVGNSGVEKLRVYPIIIEEMYAGYVIAVTRDAWGAPIIVSLNSEL